MNMEKNSAFLPESEIEKLMREENCDYYRFDNGIYVKYSHKSRLYYKSNRNFEWIQDNSVLSWFMDLEHNYETVKRASRFLTYTSDYIFKVKIREEDNVSIATFGDERHVNLMGLYLGADQRLNEIILYKLSEMILNPATLKYASDGIGESFALYWVEYNGFGDPLIVSDFETYLENDSITFKFSDHSTKFQRDLGGITYAFDEDSAPTFLRINSLTKVEYNQLISKMKVRNIPLRGEQFEQ